jgi:hypothetical protein
MVKIWSILVAFLENMNFSKQVIGMVSTKKLEKLQVLFQHEILIACVKIRIIVVLFIDSAH